MDALLYIHGFGSSGNALKAQIMKRCFSDYQVITPTLDYLTLSPNAVMETLEAVIRQHQPRLTVGSSLGGYYSIVCAARFGIRIVALNPCTNPLFLMEEMVHDKALEQQTDKKAAAMKQLADYTIFQTEVFEKAIPKKGNLNFALSTDDELLGSHQYLEKRYPDHNKIIYKDESGHAFLKFEEIVPWMKGLL